MKNMILGCSLLAVAALSPSAWADADDQRIIQEAGKNVISISQVAKLPDEAGVTITGQIARHIKGDDYEVKDASGTIKVEIDDDISRALNLKVGDHIRVIGEVDTHRYKPTDIEAVKVEKVDHKH